MSTTTLTTEDRLIFRDWISTRAFEADVIDQVRVSDDIDYRAMLARVGQGSVGYSLRTMVEEETRTGITHREFLENVCGETITGTKSICHVFEDDLRGMER